MRTNWEWVVSTRPLSQWQVCACKICYVRLFSTVFAGLNANPTVEVLYATSAEVGEGPFYEEESDTLLWVDIYKKTINFFDLKTNKNK